jgi:pyruvate,water dikinase
MRSSSSTDALVPRAAVPVRGPVVSLDDVACLDPAVSGAKAAWLARGRAAGLPVMPGVVVTVAAGEESARLAVEALDRRGSGGARLAIMREPLPARLSAALESAIVPLGAPLVVRSSARVEAAGEWAGAFTSYIGLAPGDVRTGVAGCWASAFTVDALARGRAAGLAPGSAGMAVLIQPALDPEVAGIARIEGDAVLVSAVAGSPGPLVHGWEPGAHASVAPDGTVTGTAAALAGTRRLRRVAEAIRHAGREVGATACEWAAVGDRVHLLQLGRPVETPSVRRAIPSALRSGTAVAVARVARRAPGPLGEALVVPWAVTRPDLLDAAGPPTEGLSPLEALHTAIDHAADLTRRVWGGASATDALRALRGTDPGPALGRIARLGAPDPVRALGVLGLVGRVLAGLFEAGAVSRAEHGWHLDLGTCQAILSGTSNATPARTGVGRWEPFHAAVIMVNGRHTRGVPAAGGVGAGRMCLVTGAAGAAGFRPRDVVVAVHPLPSLAPLLWDAAGLVTAGGGPGAHLFESARALGVPAVCGVRFEGGVVPAGPLAVSVDGDDGVVSMMDW